MRSGTRGAVARHIIHLAMIVLAKPLLKIVFFNAELGIADAHFLKAKFAAPGFYLISECLKINAGFHIKSVADACAGFN